MISISRSMMMAAGLLALLMAAAVAQTRLSPRPSQTLRVILNRW